MKIDGNAWDLGASLRDAYVKSGTGTQELAARCGLTREEVVRLMALATYVTREEAEAGGAKAQPG